MRKISGLIGCRSGAVRSSLRVLRIPRCRTGMRPRPTGAAGSRPHPRPCLSHPEAFLELVRGPEGLVGVRDVLEPGALGGVQVRLVLQQRPPGALDRVPDAFAGRAGPPGLAPCGVVLTLSSASAARETMWKPSRMRSVCGRRRNTHPSIHSAPLPVTTPMEARRPGVSVRKNRSKTFSPCPSCIRMTRPRSWSMTTVMYV